MNRSGAAALAMLIVVSLVFAFQNCGGDLKSLGKKNKASITSPGEPDEDGTPPPEPKLDGTCDEMLFEAFKTGFHPKLRTIGCQGCHETGKAKSDSPLADANVNVAFGPFASRGPDRINERLLVEGHNKSTLNYDNQDQAFKESLQNLAKAWHDIEKTCSLGDLSALTSEKQVDIFVQSPDPKNEACGLGDPLKSITQSFMDLTWDLGTVRQDLAGVKIRLTVMANNPKDIGPNVCAHQGYLSGDVTIITPVKLHIENVRILLNGNSYSVNTFMVVRDIPINTTVGTQLISSASGGFAVFASGSTKYEDKWSISIERIERVP
jgi:hypothetical protein